MLAVWYILCVRPLRSGFGLDLVWVCSRFVLGLLPTICLGLVWVWSGFGLGLVWVWSGSVWVCSRFGLGFCSEFALSLFWV